MTKHFIYLMVRIIPLIAFFVGLLSCTQKSSNMDSLMQIDSLLLKNNYVVAFEEINSINPDPLNEEERALYSLLLTQAQYKNFEPITSDSIINQAVNYYQNSDDKEKATRSLLYQGCVYEILGNLEKAVDCYNRADETADNNDIYNKSFACLRLGFLYQSQMIGSKSIAARKFKDALNGFKQINEKHYELVSLSELGSLYREFNDTARQDSAVLFMTEAYHLADTLDDHYFKFANLFIRAEFYNLIKNDYLQAKDDILYALSIDTTIIDHPRAHFCAASTYIHLGRRDSALYFIKKAPPIQSLADSVSYYNLLADIALFDRDYESWMKYHNQAHSMADSILIGSLNAKLFTIEKKYDLQQEELKNVSLRSKLKGAWLTVALVLLAALLLFHFFWRYRNRLRAKESEYELLKSDLSTSLSSLEQMQVTINNYENELKEAEDKYRAELSQQEALVSDLTGEIADVKSTLRFKEQERLQLNDKISVLESKKAQSDEVKAILDGQIKVVHELIQSSHELDAERFSKKFTSLMSMPESPRIATYWSNLQVLTNDLYNNILEDAIELASGKLKENDINLIALLCCGYSRTAIMICMKFNHIVTISNKKKKIAVKMGIPSLDEFIRPYQEEYEKSLK